MSRSGISKIGPRRRIAVLASACALAGASALVLTGIAGGTAAASGPPSSCSNATLQGTYTFGYNGWLTQGGTREPFSASGFDYFNGRGASTGVVTSVVDGVVVNSNAPDKSSYTINPDCTGTIVFSTAGQAAHFNVYVNPSGMSLKLIETDPGATVAVDETRVGR